MGRPADVIIADMRLQSLDYATAYILRNQASASPAPNPDPAVVPEPRFAWDTSSRATSEAPPFTAGELSHYTAHRRRRRASFKMIIGRRAGAEISLRVRKSLRERLTLSRAAPTISASS